MLKKYCPIFAAAAVVAAISVAPPSFANTKTETKTMKMVHTGNPDVDFVRNMIPHHQMAVDMAEKELKNGKSEEIRDMAEKIKSDQKKEIDDMQVWLDKNASKSKRKD